MGRANRGYKKNEPFRDAEFKVIVGEGKAETQYFAGLISQRVRFYPLPFNEDTRSAPRYIVHNASQFVSQLKNRTYDFDSYDELWVLVDVDTNSDGELSEAYEDCKNKGYHLAVSNPCFELWLLLHLNDCTDHAELLGRQGPQNCELLLRSLLGSYNKTRLDMRNFENLALAYQRAGAMDDPLSRWPIEVGSKVYRIFENLAINEIRIHN